jgi:hypothetical protein
MRCAPPALQFLGDEGTVSPSYRRRKKSKRCRPLTPALLRTAAPQRAHVATHARRVCPTRDPAGDGSRLHRRVMPGPRVVSGAVVAGLVTAGAAATAQATVRHSRVAAEIRRRLADTIYQRLGNLGTVDTLSVLPLVARRAGRPGLRGPSPASPTRSGRQGDAAVRHRAEPVSPVPLGPGRQRRGAGRGPGPGAGGGAVARA